MPLPTKEKQGDNPMNVEDSKAQRQQRSQARFRDRGGCVRHSERLSLH